MVAHGKPHGHLVAVVGAAPHTRLSRHNGAQAVVPVRQVVNVAVADGPTFVIEVHARQNGRLPDGGKVTAGLKGAQIKQIVEWFDLAQGVLKFDLVQAAPTPVVGIGAHPLL